MRIVDMAMFWAPGSGGVRTYLQPKRQWLGKQPGIDHILLVPGAKTACEAGICTLAAPPIPFGQGYRFPLARNAWIETLVALRPDLIEAGDPYVLPWVALHVGRKHDIPVIGFYHSDLPRLISTRAGAWSSRWLDRYVLSLYQRFDRVLAPSSTMTQKLRDLGVERVRQQRLGVDTSLFHPARHDPAMRAELGVDADTSLLIYAGRDSQEKNIPVLLRTMHQLGPKFHLHLVGTHTHRRLPENVSRTTGFISQERLAQLLASSDAFVHAGDRETFGLVILEAMASGIPVVGVAGGAVPELVVPGTGLLAEPRSAESLAYQIRALFAGDHRAMGKLARQHVESHYDWAQVLPGLLHHYGELVYGKAVWPGVVNA